MTLTLRPYQQAAIDGIYDYFGNPTIGNPLVVIIPTAGGKSLVMARFIEGVLKAFPDQRILIVTHVRELIEQNHAELIGLWPEAPAGIYSAGLKQRNIYRRASCLPASSRSTRRVYDVQQCDLVLIDEAHLIPRSSNTMYRRFLDGLKRINPLLKVIGFTATPYRLDSGLLHEGDGAIFTDIAFEVSVRDLIDQGYLSRLVSKQHEHATRGRRRRHARRASFIARESAHAAVDRDRHHRRARGGRDRRLRGDRRSWLVFCSGVEHAEHVARRDPRARHLLRDHRRRDAERRARCLIERLQARRDPLPDQRQRAHHRLQRPRRRSDRHAATDQVGGAVRADRRSRLPSGAGQERLPDPRLRRQHRPARSDRRDQAESVPARAMARRRSRSARTAPASFTRRRGCPDCGHVFPPPEPKIEAQASTLDVLSRVGKPEWVEVTQVRYTRHEKPGKPPSLRVEYWCGLSAHHEWICVEHAGYPRQKAATWWAARAPGTPLPRSVDEALATRPGLAATRRRSRSARAGATPKSSRRGSDALRHLPPRSPRPGLLPPSDPRRTVPICGPARCGVWTSSRGTKE
jgi:DNA repair protein RadD